MHIYVSYEGHVSLLIKLPCWPVHVIPWYLNAYHYFDEIETQFFFFFSGVCMCVLLRLQSKCSLEQASNNLMTFNSGEMQGSNLRLYLKANFAYFPWSNIFLCKVEKDRTTKEMHSRKANGSACEERMTKNLIKMMQSHDVNFIETNI